MNLGMNLGMNLYCLCTICGESIEDHAPSCPELRCKELADRMSHIECPHCYKGTVEVNRGDYYECRKCHTQFTSGEAVIGHDPATLERTALIDYDENRVIPVLILPEKGHGEIRIDILLKEAVKVRNKARRSTILRNKSK